jgi:transcriptional regulator with XRE-family HTH domain
MTPSGGKIKIPNRLWKARKRRGLGQKQLAFLIGKSVGEVSRYERGVRVPELQTILAIEIAYGAPLRILYPDLLEKVLKEMGKRVEDSGGTVYADLLAGTDRDITQPCAYQDLLQWGIPFSKEWTQVRDHVTFLAKKLAGL